MKTGSLAKKMALRHFLLPILLGCLLAPAVFGASPPSAESGAVVPAKLIRVGPTREVRSIAEAARIAHDNSTIEIDTGDYVGDVAVWTQNNLILRGVDGPVRLIANGKAAENKAIWVLRGGDMVVEGVSFFDTRVPDRNGAGIRLEKGRLTIRQSRFFNNENGILTANREELELTIDQCEFGNNGAGDGQSHNLYVGAIGSLTVTGSYFHHARVGHLLKSRAKKNLLTYNRLTDEKTGRASYELEFPSGGEIAVIGNIVQQGQNTENSNVLSIGAEGYRWPKNSLKLIHNTFIDDRQGGGNFLKVAPSDYEIMVLNNVFIGSGRLEYPPKANYSGNVQGHRKDLVNIDQGDFRLSPTFTRQAARNTSLAVLENELIPRQEYHHPAQRRQLPRGAKQPGAIQ